MSFKVAASDFDGTIYRDEKISDEDFAAIKNWRAAGNKFGIVTGRAYVMLEPHLKNYGLDVDFSICCNGAVIYDGDGKIVFETAVPKNFLVDVMNEISLKKNQAYKGKICEVIAEGVSRNDDTVISGRTDGFILVNFTSERSPEELMGRKVMVEITESKTFSLEGREVL